jgi:hypothetical protein
MSKLCQVIVTLFSLSQFFLLAVHAQSKKTPYFMTFHHPTVDIKATCNDHFYKIRDNIYVDYVKDLIAKTNITDSVASKIDSDWATTKYDFPKQRKLNHCTSDDCYSPVHIIMARGCCYLCSQCRRRELKEICGDKMLRSLQTSSLLDVVAVRKNGALVVKSEGDIGVLQLQNQGELGTSMAIEYYQAIKTNYKTTDPCFKILSDSTYKVVEMKVIPY